MSPTARTPRLFDKIEVSRILDTERVAFLAMTSNDHGIVSAEGSTLFNALDNLRAEVIRIRTPIMNDKSQARDEYEWIAMYGDFVGY